MHGAYYVIISIKLFLSFLYAVDSYVFCFVLLIPGMTGCGLESPTEQERRHLLVGLSVWGPLYVWSGLEAFLQRPMTVGGGGGCGRVRSFKAMKRSSNDPQTSHPFISIYLSASAITGWPNDWVTQPAVPLPPTHRLFTLSAFQRNLLFQMVCALLDSALREFCLTNFNTPSLKPPLPVRSTKSVILNWN